jgi:hypothetical protein
VLSEHTAAHRAAELDRHIGELLHGSLRRNENEAPHAAEGVEG